jgi:hypothetical protein
MLSVLSILLPKQTFNKFIFQISSKLYLEHDYCSRATKSSYFNIILHITVERACRQEFLMRRALDPKIPKMGHEKKTWFHYTTLFFLIFPRGGGGAQKGPYSSYAPAALNMF